MSSVVNIGLIGWGTVGTGVVKLFKSAINVIENRVGGKVCLKKVADLDLKRDRGISLSPEQLTTNASELLSDPEIHIIVELIGGIEPAKTFILEALRLGKHVVTANKALLAKYWDEIHQTAMDSHTEVYFEASVGGGIPIIQGLNEGLSANHVQSIFGIINGTANYILTKMGMGKSYVDALREAQAQGFAEADPSLDVNGGDTLNKLAILASLSFGERIFPDEIYQEGITEITAQDIRYAQEICDHEIKLLGIAKQRENNLIQVRVHPTLIPSQHLMAAIKGVFNGIYVIGDALGPAMFYGQGAGELPTASAVVSDIIYIARSIHLQVAGRLPSVYYRPKSGQRILQVEPISELDSQYYLRFTVKNEVGVIAKISNVLGEKNISIQSVIQKGQDQKEEVHLVIITYTAKEKNVVSALEIIDRMPIVTHSTLKIRMEKIDD